MITLAETYQRERQAGEEEGRRRGEQEPAASAGRNSVCAGEEEGRRRGEQEGRRRGEEEGRQQALTEYVRLFWGEATSQVFRQRLSAAGSAVWPSLRDLHAAYQAGRNPLSLLVSGNGLASGSKEDAAPATT